MIYGHLHLVSTANFGIAVLFSRHASSDLGSKAAAREVRLRTNESVALAQNSGQRNSGTKSQTQNQKPMRRSSTPKNQAQKLKLRTSG